MGVPATPATGDTTPPPEGTTPDGTTPPEQATPPAQAPNNQGAGTPNDGQEPNAQAAEGTDKDKEVDPEVRRLRDESAERRVKLREAEAERDQYKANMDDLLKKLGGLAGNTDDDDQDKQATPEQLIAQAEQRAVEAERRERDLVEENAVLLQAQDIAKTTILPFLRGSRALEALDPTAEDYAGQVKALIEKTVTEHPEFAVSARRTPSNSGNPGTPTPDHSGGEITREMLKSMSSEEIVEADRAGKLNHLKKRK